MTSREPASLLAVLMLIDAHHRVSSMHKQDTFWDVEIKLMNVQRKTFLSFIFRMIFHFPAIIDCKRKDRTGRASTFLSVYRTGDILYEAKMFGVVIFYKLKMQFRM